MTATPILPRCPSRRPSRRAVLAFGAALAALSAAVLAPAPAAAQSPATPGAVIEQFYKTLLDIMHVGSSLGFSGRFDRLRPVVEQTFDLPLMTRVVVGAGWSTLPADQQRALIDAFTRFTIANYARNFRTFDGERLEVKGAQEIAQGTMVQSVIVPSDGKPVPINYLMRAMDGRWRVIDVFLNATISELATRRSDFAQTLRDGGPAALIRRLDEKVREMAAA